MELEQDCACFNYIKDIIFLFNSQDIAFKHVTLQGKTGHFLLNSFLFFLNLGRFTFLRVGWRVEAQKVTPSNMAEKERRRVRDAGFQSQKADDSYLTGGKHPLGHKLGQRPGLNKW